MCGLWAQGLRREPHAQLTEFKPRVTGRPTKKTPTVLETLLKALREGVPEKSAARIAGISPRTLQNWKSEDEEFAESVAGARDDPDNLARRTLVESMQNGDVETAKFWVSRRCEEFAPPKPVEPDPRAQLTALAVAETILAMEATGGRNEQGAHDENPE